MCEHGRQAQHCRMNQGQGHCCSTCFTCPSLKSSQHEKRKRTRCPRTLPQMQTNLLAYEILYLLVTVVLHAHTLQRASSLPNS